MKESNRIELKRGLTDSLEKEVLAFLNYRGGLSVKVAKYTSLVEKSLDDGQTTLTDQATDQGYRPG